jgi:hypothetical protein
MADILSLSKARKAKARAEKETQAQQNRIRFGRTKAEKLKEKADAALTERRIEAHRLGPKPDPCDG